ncbi:MAG: BsuBI/PstI family type II restriction endonuclease [Pseudomonadota bacterium]
MGKIDEAQEILKALGMPPAQQNEMAALTFLALTGLEEKKPWRNARSLRLRIHDILIFTNKAYGREYAENTRETVRRQVIHQFEQARIVDKNPDDPSLPTNSPRTHYALTDQIIDLVRGYGAPAWKGSLKRILGDRQTLWEVYQKKRKSRMVPVRLASGKELLLSPGKHNELQAAVVEEFAPRFAPGSNLVYMGDTERKALYLDEKLLESLVIPVTEHDKLPDVLLYDGKRRWLFLIEAVTSHGPVSPKRQYELEQMLSASHVGRIYVSAFPDFKEFKRHIGNIAWETEVWLSEIPDHLIHFNGEKFMGPYK